MDVTQLLSLGIGGAIAGVVMFWKRADDQKYTAALANQATQLIELNKLTLEVVSKNTAALVEVTSAVRSLGMLERIERRLDALDITEAH